MAIIVVGGHTRNIGKTGVVCGLIAAMPERGWTSLKITQFGHGVCSANGEPCDCETADHTIAVSEERDAGSGTDTSRYLAAGAKRSFWVRTRQGQLHEAMPRVRKLLAGSEHVIVESNSVLRFLRPDLYLSVLDPASTDFKPSSMRYLDRADALVLTSTQGLHVLAESVALRHLLRTSRFVVHPPQYGSEELTDFCASRLSDHTSVKEELAKV